MEEKVKTGVRIGICAGGRCWAKAFGYGDMLEKRKFCTFAAGLAHLIFPAHGDAGLET